MGLLGREFTGKDYALAVTRMLLLPLIPVFSGGASFCVPIGLYALGSGHPSQRVMAILLLAILMPSTALLSLLQARQPGRSQWAGVVSMLLTGFLVANVLNFYVR